MQQSFVKTIEAASEQQEREPYPPRMGGSGKDLADEPRSLAVWALEKSLLKISEI